MPEKTRVMTAHIPVDLAKKIDKMAAKIERTRGWVVKQALRDWISYEEWKYRETLEGLKQVREGKVISDDEMKRWLDGLK